MPIEATNGRLKNISLDTLSNEEARLPAALAAYWNTMGWVKFQQGDSASAEKYTLATWQLRSIGEIGDHLGQIEEKSGRKQDTIALYSIVLASNASLTETEARLIALLGKDADLKSLEQDARSKFVKSRNISMKNSRDSDGEAEFWLLMEHGPAITSTKFISGDESLRALSDDLKTMPLDFFISKRFRKQTSAQRKGRLLPFSRHLLRDISPIRIHQIRQLIQVALSARTNRNGRSIQRNVFFSFIDCMNGWVGA